MSSETVAICTRKQDVRATKMELRKLILFRKWFRLRKGVRQTCKLKKFFLCILKKKNFCVETFYNVKVVKTHFKVLRCVAILEFKNVSCRMHAPLYHACLFHQLLQKHDAKMPCSDMTFLSTKCVFQKMGPYTYIKSKSGTLIY